MIHRLKFGIGVMFTLLLTWAAAAHEAADMPSLTKGDYGMSFVSWYGNDAFSVIYGVTLYIDPVNIPADQPKADAILFTHPHPENFNLGDIRNLLGGYTNIYGPQEVITQIKESDLKLLDDQLHVVKPYDEIVTGSYSFTTVPAYNTTKDLHPQVNNWVGYIISIITPRGEAKLYFSGDTNLIPEMESLAGKIDVAFISIDPEHGMDNLVEAVKAVTMLDPEIAVPMHYSGEPGSEAEADKFVGMLSEIDGIDGIMMNKK